jgi:hypothetical protein
MPCLGIIMKKRQKGENCPITPPPNARSMERDASSLGERTGIKPRLRLETQHPQ